MNLIILDHAKFRMHERGITTEEVILVMERGQPKATRAPRKAKETVFPFEKE